MTSPAPLGPESQRLLADLKAGADVPDLASAIHVALITDLITAENRWFGLREEATAEEAVAFIDQVEARRCDEDARKASWKTAPSRLLGPVRACKDIPDHVLLAAVAVAMGMREQRQGESPQWATRWDVAAVLMADHARVGGAPVAYPDLPEKVLLAKLGKLKARGLVDCCTCGCRSDITLTHLVPFAPNLGTCVKTVGCTFSIGHVIPCYDAEGQRISP